MNITIVISPLDADIDALTKENVDGSYTIFVNNHLSDERAKRAILHEIFHIKNNDFSSFQHASILERMLRESNYFEKELEEINFYYHII